MGGEDLTLLQKCPENLQAKLLHCIFDVVCERESAYEQFSQHYTLDEWWRLTDAWTEVGRDAVKSNSTKDDIESKLSCLSRSELETFVAVLQTRRDQVKKHLLHSVSQISSSYLKDFDWQLKLVMSSDQFSSIHEPLMCLDLDVGGQDSARKVSVEMNKADLQKFISSLEAANKAVLQLKT